MSFSILCILLGCGSAGAGSAPWADKLFNPAPAPDDKTLPMPCGGAMVFRVVVTPADGPLGDADVRLGGVANPQRGVVEAPYPAYVAGGLPDGKTTRAFWLGKYEVTQDQWQAVMGATCPSPSLAGRLPKTGVSWSDAVAFADRYQQWLLSHAAGALPKDGAEAAFVRLPTEAEWEYAARGGSVVSPADFHERLYPMPEGLAAHAWFAGTQSANGKLQVTGLLKPNPLGLHDMLGNADEVVLDPFRLNRLQRLHGQAGGFVVRGGNYLTAEADIYTASRQEIPPYDKDGPRRAATSGMRLALSLPVLTSAQKMAAAQQAWEKLGASDSSSPLLAGGPMDDPLDELGLLATSTADPVLKRRLEGLGLALRTEGAARDAVRDRAVRASLRLGAFLGRKLGEDSVAVAALDDVRKARLATGDTARANVFQDQLDQEQQVLDDNLRYYADTVISAAETYGVDVLQHQRDVLKIDLQNRGLMDIIPYLERYLDHVLTYGRDHRVSRRRWLEEWLSMQKQHSPSGRP